MGKKKPKMRVAEYRMSIHFGICLNSTSLKSIIIGEKIAWTGDRSTLSDIAISKGNLFGGIKKEGGAVGSAIFLPGKPDQILPERVRSKYGLTADEMPGYRELTSIYFTEAPGAGRAGFLWGANSPYLKPVWAKVSSDLGVLDITKERIYRDLDGSINVYFLLDRSVSLSPGQFQTIKNAAYAGLDLIQAFMTANPTVRVDVAVRFYSDGSVAIGRTKCSLADIQAIRDFMAAATQVSGGQVDLAMAFVRDWFLASATVEFDKRMVVFVTDSMTEDGMTAAASGPAANMINRTGPFANEKSVDMYSINYNTTNTEWTSLLDNTPEDGIPILTGADASGLTNAVKNALLSRDFDINPAHTIYAALTFSLWGAGLPPTMVDEPSFMAAANTLYEEKFGCTFLWMRQGPVEDFIREVLDHIEGALFLDPTLGKFVLVLIRGDYEIDDLPVFDEYNSKVTSFKRKLWGETINEVIVSYTDPKTEELVAIGPAQDPGNIAIQGLVSSTREYYGIRVARLAQMVAWRDLRSGSYPLASADIEVDRGAWDIRPGKCIVLRSKEDNVAQIVMRVGPVDYGKIGSPTIKATVVEDVFALPTAQYEAPAKSAWEDSSEQPKPAAFEYAFTIPYYVVATANVADIEYPTVYAGVLAAQTGTDTAAYDLYGDIATPATGDTYVGNLGTMTIISHAVLTDALVPEVTSTIPVTLARTQGLGPETGSIIVIGDGSEHEVELALVTDVSGVVTINRGILDTVPRAWPIGTPIWYLGDGNVFADTSARAAGETLDYFVLPRTSLGILDISQAEPLSVTLTDRPWLPNRPANVIVGGVAFGVVDCIGLTTVDATWSTRNRVTEDAVILRWDEASVTPEVDQTTVIELTKMDGTVLYTYAGLTGTSQTIDLTNFGTEVSGIIRFGSMRDGHRELQPFDVLVLLIGPPVLSDFVVTVP